MNSNRKVKICETCGDKFTEVNIIDGHRHRLRNRKSCLKCLPFKKTFPQTNILLTCKTCNKEFTRTSGNFRESKSGFYFCSKSCSAKTTGKIYPKRHKTGKCKICQKLIAKRITYCEDCKPDYLIEMGKKTLKYFADKRKDSNRYASVRS